MTDAIAQEMLDLARDIGSRLDAMASDVAEMAATMRRMEAAMAECLAMAAQAAGQPTEQDEPRRLH